MSDIDLNLLTALDALLTEGSVTKAGARLKLSPSAMSRTLARLRTADRRSAAGAGGARACADTARPSVA